MNSQPDHLIRSKVEHFHMPAPARAWNRIERNLEKRSRFVWLKAAASVVVVVAAALWIMKPDSKTETMTLADSSPANNALLPAVQIPPAEVPMQTQAVQRAARSKKTQAVTKSTEPVVVMQEGIALAQEETIALTETPAGVLVQPETAVEETVASAVIVYTAAEVHSKYLLKKAEPEATPETKKTSRFQMLAGLAYNFSTGESGLGNLRDKKNEILALNFLDNKKPGTQAGKEKKN